MRKTLINLIAIAALSVSVNVASAQRGGHGGGYGGGHGGGHGGGGFGAYRGGGGGRGGPGPSFHAPSGSVGGHSRSMGGHGRPGVVVHAPRSGRGTVQHQNRATRRYRVSPGTVQHQYRAKPQYRVSPNVVRRAPLRKHTSRKYTQRRLHSLSGKYHKRYRHRRHGYAYYYGGWWYAFPWWLERNYNDYDYWSSVCAYRWGYYTSRYYRCMAYYGFY